MKPICHVLLGALLFAVGGCIANDPVAPPAEDARVDLNCTLEAVCTRSELPYKGWPYYGCCPEGQPNPCFPGPQGQMVSFRCEDATGRCGYFASCGPPGWSFFPYPEAGPLAMDAGP